MTLKKYRWVAIILSILVFFAILAALLMDNHFPLLNPSGWVGEQQKNLLVFTVILSLFVIIPVFYMLIAFTTKYHESKKAKYEPELDNHVGIEVLWWAVPILLITILSVVTFRTSHSLDPFKSLESDKKPVTIQVIAMPWKWLFLYPDQQVASVNYVKIPTDRPVEFRITSDAPMNSFWIPDLGGQIYAMAGMESELNLIADKPGEYPGLSANLSGEGFSDMKFVASAVSESDYNQWIEQVRAHQGLRHFDQATYDELVKPSIKTPVELFHLHDSLIFRHAIDKYMGHNMTNERSY